LKYEILKVGISLVTWPNLDSLCRYQEKSHVKPRLITRLNSIKLFKTLTFLWSEDSNDR